MTTTYQARSVKGRPVAIYDREKAARAFISNRKQHGVNLHLVRVTVEEEKLS